MTTNLNFKKYLNNTSWLMFDKIFRLIVNVFLVVYIARYLGPDQFGLFSFVRSVAGILIVFSSLGLDQIVVKSLVEKQNNHDVLLGSSFLLKFISALSINLLIVLILLTTTIDKFTLILILILSTSTFFNSFNVIDFFFQSKLLGRLSTLSSLIAFLFSSMLKIILIIFKAKLIYFFVALFSESLVLACGLVYYYKKLDLKLINWRYDNEVAKYLMKKSWPLILSGLVITIYMRIDQIMIKYFFNNTLVGQYSAAVRISEAWYFIPTVISIALFPAILNSKNDQKKFYDRLKKLYTLMIWIAISVALPLTFVSEDLIVLLYGQKYLPAGQVLSIHIWTSIFVFLGLAYQKYLIAVNFEKKAFYRASLGAVVNIILNLILIPKFNIIGAAYATFIGQMVANYLYDFFDNDVRKQFFIKSEAFFPIYLFQRKK